ncbi:MAG: hypothetical protein CMP48_12350 [Rickettsiales bacterium]|uniref:hypothetical protein n=1 Tax=Marinoscillum pacificum TaxID=392723 RepID=UPI000C5049A0|nr:hypothetical protein [Marinoscillum pacificum]MBR08454.1 hypothetical protein [Rickettsiales bacterium]|tara:strand:+ start:216 stop:527 length:312 start_codon:yes stop_codon:yes gene_type:complete
MDIIDVGLYASYLLIALCAVAAIVIPLAQSFGDPQSLVKSGIGLGVIVVVFLISYAMADSVTTNKEVTEGAAKLSGAGLIAMYIFFFIALIGIVYTEISKLLK